MKVEQLAKGFGLLEGPVWDPTRGLLFADAEDGGVHCLDADRTITTVVQHRRGIGGVALHERDGLVVSGRNLAFKSSAGETVVLFEHRPDEGIVGFNDITTDSRGRIYAGALGYRPTEAGELPRPGGLYLLDLDGSRREVVENVQLTNGLAFSPDGRLLYHSDSGDQTVYVCELDSAGDVVSRRRFAGLKRGLPDGLVVAADGTIWVAVAHAGLVVVFNPDGSIRDRLEFPVPMVTSLCFGGHDLKDLYVVTGSDGVPGGRAGAVFLARVDVPGLPVGPARVPISGS
jgi:gluconolactonase